MNNFVLHVVPHRKRQRFQFIKDLVFENYRTMLSHPKGVKLLRKGFFCEYYLYLVLMISSDLYSGTFYYLLKLWIERRDEQHVDILMTFLSRM